jgi:hypothetical protein
MAAAAIGDFENAEKDLLSAKPPWLALIQQYRDAHRPWEVPLEEVYADMFAGWAAQLDAAKAKWEEGAPARAAEWEKGAPARKAAEEVARLKAEIARVEQEEVERQAALAKEALEKLRIQKEEEEEKQRKAEVTALERDAAALREKLAAMKGLNAEKRERDEKEKKDRNDRLAEMERETAVVRENLAVMKELMAMKAAFPTASTAPLKIENSTQHT